MTPSVLFEYSSAKIGLVYLGFILIISDFKREIPKFTNFFVIRKYPKTDSKYGFQKIIRIIIYGEFLNILYSEENSWNSLLFL